MAWEQLSINKPHLVYIILGAFTSLFMLCSSVIKERLYIGEATVATLCGIIFGPHAADLINPGTWGNTDQITEEFSRLVLVIQCFAVGVELPKAYMERHWRSVVFLLVPVMTFGWLITSLFIWAFFFNTINWLDSLCIAACVTATDPVLASSVVGKGKFAKRVPKHLRDLLSAESGCNDGMAFPFVYLALYIIRYYGHPDEVSLHWFCVTILYECVFGAIYGVLIGYIARRAIRYAHEKNLIDRESFLVYYFVLALFCAGSGSLLGMDDLLFVLALFCAGSGSLLGMDDLLVGFACGVGFSNDGWFQHQTEESHVSNVIDLLINLAFFVYFGTIIPWEQYNNGEYGIYVWKLVVIGILVLLFRRIPIMMALKPFIPDVKTWREALFAGHFGPIGVGAIFVAILARAELETGETTPLEELPPPDTPHDNVIVLIWPIVTFLVICSILVHGSSIAVFTLGKHINTLTLTMSYTQANEGPSWMDRLPRIQSRAKTQTSDNRDDSSIDEKERRAEPSDFPAGFPILRRVREDDRKGSSSRNSSRAPSRHRSRHSKNWEHGPGGPISQGAIGRDPRELNKPQSISRSDSETLANKDESPDTKKADEDDTPPESQPQSPGEIYEEGGETVYEDEEGNVLAVERTNEHGHEREEDEAKEGRRLMHEDGADHNHGVDPTQDDPNTDTGHELAKKASHVEEEAEEAIGSGGKSKRHGLSRLTSLAGMRKSGEAENKAKSKPKEEKKTSNGPARAYQYGNTIIVEDEDGEVIKKYDIPAPDRGNGASSDVSKHRIGRMSKMFGLGGATEENEQVEPGAPGQTKAEQKPKRPEARRMFSSKQPQAANNNEDNDGVRFTVASGGRRMSAAQFISYIGSVDPRTRVQLVEDSTAPEPVKEEARKEAREQAAVQKHSTAESNVPVIPEDASIDAEDAEHKVRTNKDDDLELVDSNEGEIPFHDISAELKKRSAQSGESAAERRRRLALQRQDQDDSDDDGTERQPPRRNNPAPRVDNDSNDNTETAAERRRRLGALGQQEQEPEHNVQRQSTLRWGKDKRSG